MFLANELRRVAVISRLEIQLKASSGKKYSSCLASVLQGALYEIMDSDYVDVLHKNSINLYSQYVRYKNGKMYWIVNALDEKSYSNIIEVLNSREQLYIKNKKDTVQLLMKKIDKVDIDELFETYYKTKQSNYINIEFITPTSFKKDGSYIVYPDLRLIFRSIMLKYEKMIPTVELYSEELLKEITDSLSIVKYNLKSTGFYMDKTRINSFKGSIKLKIKDEDNMINLVWYLLKFAEYCGVGAKTGLGMGAVRIF